MSAVGVEFDLLTVESIGAWSAQQVDWVGLPNDEFSSPGVPDGPFEAQCTRCSEVRQTLSRASWVKLRCESCRSSTLHRRVDADEVLRACRYLEQLLVLITDSIGYTEDGSGSRVSVDLYVDDQGITTRREVVIRGRLPMTQRLAALRWAWRACGYVYDVRYGAGSASNQLCSWDIPVAYDRSKRGGYHLGVCVTD